MKGISIKVTDQEQQRLKAMASLQGKSIKEFVGNRKNKPRFPHHRYLAF